jgi:hypothetical protein
MSILKEVDDEWIIRRLERWGKKDNMPFLGPQKASILQDVIRERKPQLIVEVGGMCGYSAIKMAQVLPKGSSSRYRLDSTILCCHTLFLAAAVQPVNVLRFCISGLGTLCKPHA